MPLPRVVVLIGIWTGGNFTPKAQSSFWQSPGKKKLVTTDVIATVYDRAQRGGEEGLTADILFNSASIISLSQLKATDAENETDRCKPMGKRVSDKM